MLRQLYSNEQCFRLIENFSKEKARNYDYYMFARPDAHYLPPGVPDIRPLIKGNTSIASRFYDRFAVCHPHAIQVWAHRMQSASNFLKDTSPGGGLHAERLLLYHLCLHRISLSEIRGFCFFRVRAIGATEELRDTHDCYHMPTYSEQNYHNLWTWLIVGLPPIFALVVLFRKPISNALSTRGI